MKDQQPCKYSPIPFSNHLTLLSHPFSADQLAEIDAMYNSEPVNDYDIVEYVEKFTDDDTVYQEYADQFKKYPELDSPHIHLKLLTVGSFDDLCVKALDNFSEWDKTNSSDKICLSSTFRFIYV